MNVVGRKVMIVENSIWKYHIGIITAQFRRFYRIQITNNSTRDFLKDEVGIIDNDNNHLVNVYKFDYCMWCGIELNYEFLNLNNREFYIHYCPKCLR